MGKSIKYRPSTIYGRQPLKKLKRYGLLQAEHTPPNFLKAIFHKFYLNNSWILCPKCGSGSLNFNEKSLVLAFCSGTKTIKDWKTAVNRFMKADNLVPSSEYKVIQFYLKSTKKNPTDEEKPK